jgi:hypothetical protein
MNVLIAWSKGEGDYTPGLVKYVSLDLSTAPVVPPPPPPKLPACTGSLKDFCRDGDSTEAWCCNILYHGCVCTDYGDYNHIMAMCRDCKGADGCVHCPNKKGKCKWNGGEAFDCCPEAKECKNGLPWEE